MSQPNTPQKTLESWKQIAGYLIAANAPSGAGRQAKDSPSTAASTKSKTVFAYRHEIEAWSRLRTKCPVAIASDEPESLSPAKPRVNTYLVEHDAITRTMHRYIASARTGDGSEYQSPLCAHRDHREHRRCSSRSSTLVRQVGWCQCQSLRRIHSAQGEW